MSKLSGKKPSFKVVQPIVLFAVGILAFAWQVLVENVDRPYLLALIAGMLGLPFVLLADKARNQGGEESSGKDADVDE